MDSIFDLLQGVENKVDTNAFTFAPPPQKVYGYEMRQPYESELEYFKNNPSVSGMAADDRRIILNPYSGLSYDGRKSVAKNEAARLFMREKNYDFDFDVTTEQMNRFEGTEYGKKENFRHLQSTIIARIIAGDNSAGRVTPEQKKWADRVFTEMEKRK